MKCEIENGKTRISDKGNRILERPVSKTVLLVNRSVFDSPTRKQRSNELVQDTQLYWGSHVLVHHGGVHPK